MINPLFLPQNSKRRKKPELQSTSRNAPVRRQFKLIHQLDCIYQGQVNASYQKQGFGIQQTNDFHMYLGFWRSNKANGIGLVIYPEGGIIYGNFKDNDLNGLALVDNKKKLRIGIFENFQIAGIGIEYVYSQTKWKLSSFHKGISIETIAQTVSSIENGIPSLLNLHQDMNILLTKHLNEQYFDIPNKNLMERPYRSYSQMNVHKIDANYLYFGQVVDDKYWGLGIIYDNKSGHTLQTGYYEMGQINGYGLKIDKDKNQIQIGLYNKGKKEGFFYQKVNNLEKIVKYQKNYVKGDHPQMNRQKINMNQKIFNYQKNDFYSEKNKINFQGLRVILDVDQKQLSKLNQTLKSNILSGHKNLELTGKKSTQKVQHSHGQNKPNKYMAPELIVQKSTVQFIREKLGDIDNIIKRSKAIMKEEKQKKQQSKKGQILQIDTLDQQERKPSAFDDDEIYQQDQPVSNDYKLKDFYKQNQNIKITSRNLTPKSTRKTRQLSKSPVCNTTGQKKKNLGMDRNHEQNLSSFIFFDEGLKSFQRSPNKTDRNTSKRAKRRIFE